MSRKILALLMGDRYGIGPELIVKLIHKGACGNDVVPMVAGDRRVFDDAAARLGLEVDLADEVASAGDRPVFTDLPFDAPIGPLGKVSAAAGRECLLCLDWLATALNDGRIAGALYAPLNKQAMREAGHSDGDELAYLTRRLDGGDEAGEINVLDGLWTSRVTSHVPLSAVADLITADRIGKAASLLHAALQRAGHKTPRIAVAGLNPHAGDGGAFGREEIDIIAPEVDRLRKNGIDAFGPVPPDTVFPQARRDGADGVVTMYHDQGQIALKLLGLGRSVTLLAGLRAPIVTPGHGTAFDIVGTGTALTEGSEAALQIGLSLLSAAPKIDQAGRHEAQISIAH